MGAVGFRYWVHGRRSWTIWLRLAAVCGVACALPLGVAANARRAQSALERAFASQRGADVVVTADVDDNGEPVASKGTPIGALHIVGEVRRPEEFLDDASDRSPQIYLPPAFGVAFPEASYYSNDFIRLVGGRAATASFRAKVQALAATYGDDQANFVAIQDALDRAGQALRPQIVAWLLLAAVSFVAALAIVGQTIRRRMFAENRDLADLHSLGMTRRDLTLLGVLQAATIAFAALCAAVALAVASSLFTPIGSTHGTDPDRGLRVDPAVMIGGAMVMLLALVLLSFAPARRAAWTAAPASGPNPRSPSGWPRRPVDRINGRRSRAVSALARAGCPPTLVVGSGFALQPSRDVSAARLRGVFSTVVLAIGVLVVAVAFSADLDHLVKTPREYGWNWDVGITANFGSVPDDTVARIAARPEVAAAAGFTEGSVSVDGTDVPAIGIEQLRGTVFPTMDTGRPVQSASDIVLGSLTLGALHKSVGDSVAVTTPAGTRSLTIVGTATFPGIGANRFAATGLGSGAVVPVDVLPSPADESHGRFGGMFITLDPTLDRTAAIASLHQYVLPFGCGAGCFVTDLRPLQLKGYSDLGNIWAPFVVVLGLLFAISLAHGILWSAGLRNRDLRVLAALGFSRWQLAATIAWQAITIALVSVVVGLGAGLLASNAGWHVFTDRFGIDPGTSTSARQLAIIAAAVVAGAAVVGLGAVPGVIRTRDGRRPWE